MLHSGRKVTLATYLQPSFGNLPAGAAINGILLPKKKSGNKVTRSREEIENDTEFDDGFERPDGKGDFSNEFTLDIIPNLDYLPYVQHLFMGGADNPVGTTEFTREREFSDAVNLFMVEEGYPSLTVPEYWRHRDHVLTKISVKYALNSLFSISGSSTGSGNWTKETAPLDATFTKVEGTPCDFSEAAIELDGNPFHVIELSADMERIIAWKRDSEGAGKATFVTTSRFTGRGSVKVYKKDSVLEEAAHATNAPLMSLSLLYQKGTKLTEFAWSEIQLFAKDGVDNAEEGSTQSFEWKMKKLAGVNPPFLWKTVSGLAAIT